MASPLQQKSAVCVSTIDEEGFPHGRFVDLKTVDECGFVFCTSYDSLKGKHLSANPKVSITAWWDHVGYQVRIVGLAEKIKDPLADEFWYSRSVDAQNATNLFQQSERWEASIDPQTFFIDQHGDNSEPLPRPMNWGGFLVVPEQVEFLTFRDNRVHLREHFYKATDGWEREILQP